MERLLCKSNFVDVIEEAFVVAVDAEAEVGALLAAQVTVDLVLQVVDAGGQLTGIHFADAGAPGIVPLEVLWPGIVVVVGVVFLFPEIDVHQVVQGILHEVQRKTRTARASQDLTNTHGMVSDIAGIAGVEEAVEFVVEHIVSILRVHGDDAALRRTATEIVDFATAGDVSSFLVCHSLQQFKS